MVNESNESVVMFDTENSIVLCDYLDLLLNRTMDLEEAYGEKPTEGAYIKCQHEKLVKIQIPSLASMSIFYMRINARRSAWAKKKR